MVIHDLNGMTDEALYERLRRGDESAFRALYEKYRDPLFRFGWRMTGSAGTAEDLTHDCFIGLLTPGFDPQRSSLKTYLYAAMRNLCRKHHRDTGSEDIVDAEESAVAPGALDSIIAAETAVAVRTAVEALPILQREVLVLFEYEELSMDEIATIAGIETGAVKSRLFRARESLRRMLAPKLNQTAEATKWN